MELESSYQLLGILRDDGIRTYRAIEIASGQALQVHLFASPTSETDRALFKALRTLPVNKRRELLEIGTEGDQPYIVTEPLADTTTARQWLTKLSGFGQGKPGGPVIVAGSWKTGTPIPDDLVRASHASLPPKPPPPPAKPAELSPDYTRVMRLPQALGAIPRDAPVERAAEIGPGPVMGPAAAPPAVPSAFASGPGAMPPALPSAFAPGPAAVPPALPSAFAPGPSVMPPAVPSAFAPGPAAVPPAVPSAFAPGPSVMPPAVPSAFAPGPGVMSPAVPSAFAPGPSVMPSDFASGPPSAPSPSPSFASSGVSWGGLSAAGPPPLPPATASGQPEVYWGALGSGPPPAEPPAEVGSQTDEFDRMMLAAYPVEAKAEGGVQLETPAAAPEMEFPSAEPIAPAPPIVAPELPREPGEFTRMFMAAQPSEPAPPAGVPLAGAPPAGVSPAGAPQPQTHEPGEFTRMFLASQKPQPAPPVQQSGSPQPGEFTSQFPAARPAETAPRAEESTRIFQPMSAPAPPPPLEDRQALPQEAFPQQGLPQQALPQEAFPQEALPQQAVPPTPSSDEKTRLFQVVTPSAPPVPAKEPGTFTRSFPSPVQPSPDQPAGIHQPDEGPSEFTRFFQSPMYPTAAGNQRVPSAAPSGNPIGPMASRPPAQGGEFTQMFGTPGRPDAGNVMPPAPLAGSNAPGSATGAFSLSNAPLAPPPKGSGPGEFTRMMSASAAPTLGQPPAGQSPAQSSAPAPTPGETRSMMPLYIAGGAILLAIILIILFFLLRK